MVPSQLLLRPPITSMDALSVVLTSVLLATSVSASESTNATCTQDPFLTNKEDVDPCRLATMLQGACSNGNFFLPALPQGQIYDGPSAATSDSCQCSSVTYSVVQACAVCQDGATSPWLTWSEHCVPDQIAIGSYPIQLQNVSVPQWAFVNVTLNGTFNALQASALATLSESVLAPTSTSPSNSNTSPASNSKSSSHTGAIVGGVIGGIVVLALICLGAFFLYRRQRKSPRIQPRSVQEKVDMTQPNYGYSDSYSLAPPKLYDPADPTTFPQSPAPTTSNSLWTRTATPPPTSPGHRHGNSSGSYSGFPEL